MLLYTFHLTGSMAYSLKIWENSKYQRPLLYWSFLVMSFGGIIGPLVVQQFTGDIHSTKYSDNNNASDQHILSFNASDISSNTTLVVDDSTIKEVSRVRLSYVVISSIWFLSSLLFVVTFLLLYYARWDGTMKYGDTYVAQSRPNDTKSKEKSFYALMMLLFIYYYCEGTMESIAHNLLAVFVVNGLGWSNDSGALATAILWGGMMASQVLNIPLSMVMSLHHIVISSVVIMTSGIMLLFCVHIHMIFLWAGVFMLGLGMGSLYPAGVLWADEYIDVTVAVSSCALCAYSTGTITGPLLTGFLLDNISYTCFIYTLVGMTCVFMATYMCAISYTKYAFIRRARVNPL